MEWFAGVGCTTRSDPGTVTSTTQGSPSTQYACSRRGPKISICPMRTMKLERKLLGVLVQQSWNLKSTESEFQ